MVRSLPSNPKVPGSIPGSAETGVHSAFHPSEVGKMSTSMHGLLRSGCNVRLYMLPVRWGKLIIVKRLWDVVKRALYKSTTLLLLCMQKHTKRQVKDNFKYAFVSDVCHRCLCVISDKTWDGQRKWVFTVDVLFLCPRPLARKKGT